MRRVTGTLRERIFMIISRSILLRTRNFSCKSCRKNQNTHVTWNCFLLENRAFLGWCGKI